MTLKHQTFFNSEKYVLKMALLEMNICETLKYNTFGMC